MKLVSYALEGVVRVGRLNAAGTAVQAFPGEAGSDMLHLIRRFAQIDNPDEDHGDWVALDRIQLLAPIPRPARNILCVGKNYHQHAVEFQASGFDASASENTPEFPVIFTKAPSSVIGPEMAIPAYLDYSESTDYEGELAVVIGRGGRNIAKADALTHVFGYTIVNDVTSRTLQQTHRQWFLGKSLDGYCPMGPAIVTADEIPAPEQLQLKTWVNGELRQHAGVADLIFDIPTLIETISRTMSLESGDIIATGTCAGVGIGFTPPRFLRHGDRVEIEIQPIGRLVNPVLALRE
ncbi:fumarylacetoacetate hydrolase family protein [Sodalis ligni]|jgi:2-keto-4-pentenoate hydratase/2-oxohepta-3-ene-1,7-dioic acid hydratase in catechol pathway|uniref:2-keto-4-pentenoate hydratase/2-oxohepta-3-ene-1,7-dioic acid hydratase in catechol pathway n=1 Tax=Sodalis ligni TaxID=2697027 RepID=A0A4R1NH72_9GAMM|nr:fumarylacetoacetate hydrolase family protein [Sodalis ligni]TCL05161.1 2-keto-4-pentenoate hydratase/2-oxohepta-3-ene-1,7-dioic acid hydratase in catechol pathway [Sodalis ligni]